tara:strand:- start:844 stop:1242 length:399 start_codon:yes stop_codon:yes gene_type:complete
MLKKIFNQKILIKEKSMEPTLKDGDFITMKKIFFKYKAKRFDLILFNFENRNYIKRVIGINNETIEALNGNILIDGVEIKEYYLTNKINFNFSKIKLKKDEIYVLGDNREMSKDSRVFGPVKIHNILSFYRV